MNMEEKYYTSRDENIQLKKVKNEQEITIKRMYTKIAMLEDSLKNGSHKNDQVLDGKKRDFEAERFIVELKDENNVLRKKYQSVVAKNKKLNEELIRLHKVGRKRTPRSTRVSKSSSEYASDRNRFSGGVKNSYDTGKRSNGEESKENEKSDELVTMLRKRLVASEKQIGALQRKLDRLGDNQEDEDTEVDSPTKGSSKKPYMSDDMDYLQCSLRDKQTQLNILTTRYDNLETKCRAEREIQDRTLEQMEGFNRTIRELRKQVQQLTLERDQLEDRMARNKDLDEELHHLRDQNRKLESRMTSLCESPFINDAFQKKERIEKILKLEQQDRRQKDEILNLQNAVKLNHDALVELKEKVKKWKTKTEAVELERDQLRSASFANQLNASNNEATSAQMESALQDAVIPAAAEPVATQNIDMGSKASAMALVSTVALEIPTSDAFLEQVEPGLHTVADLKNRLHKLQALQLNTIKDLDRCERMLQAQVNINRDLSLEIEEIGVQKRASQTMLENQLDDYQALANDRLRKINALEGELKKLKYSGARSMNRLFDVVNEQQDNEVEETESVTDSVALSTANLGPGENSVEVWIVNGQFDDSSIDAGACTFIICDFFDFESQSTSLVVGREPNYNYAATFKVSADEFFLRYLATEDIKFEVQQAHNGDFQVIGHVTMPLKQLLGKRGKTRNVALPIQGAENGACIGSIHVVMRVAKPMYSLWQDHIQLHPEDSTLYSLSENVSAIAPIVHSPKQTDEQDNLLQVNVISCENLTRTSNNIPSPYVHYQFLGFEDSFTNIVPKDSNPQFDSSSNARDHEFKVTVDSNFIRFLAKYVLVFTVFDDTVVSNEQNEQKHDNQFDKSILAAVIGMSKVPLIGLVDGNTIGGSFNVVNGQGKICGQISISINWKYPLKVSNYQMHTNFASFSGKDIESLVEGFKELNTENVLYQQLVRYICQSKKHKQLFKQIKVSLINTCDGDQERSSNDMEACGIVLGSLISDPAVGLTLSDLSKLKTKHNVAISDEDLRWLYTYVNYTNGDSISVLDLQRYLTEPEPNQEKLYERARHILLGSPPQFEVGLTKSLESFETFFNESTSSLNMKGFIRGLETLGFHISKKTDHQEIPVLKGNKPNTYIPLQQESFKVQQIDSNTTAEFERRRLLFIERMKHASAKFTTPNLEDCVSAPTGLPFIQQKNNENAQSVAPPKVAETPSRTNIVCIESVLHHYFTNAPDEVARKRELLQLFQQVDRQSSNMISKSQLAHVLNSLKDMKLSPPQLSCLFNFFADQRNNDDENMIVFSKLIRFMNFQPSEEMIPLGVKLLRKLSIEKSSVKCFAKFDAEGNGMITHMNFSKCCSELGLSCSEQQVFALFNLFDTSGMGVAYKQFVAFAAEQPYSIILSSLIRRLGNHEAAIKRISSLDSSSQNGKITKTSLLEMLNECGIICSTLEIDMLVQRLDVAKSGYLDTNVLMALFAHNPWDDYSDVRIETDQDLQQYCWNSLSEIAKNDMDLTQLWKIFGHYDPNERGYIPSICFSRCLDLCGYVLTKKQIDTVASNFKKSKACDDVAYYKFIDWSTMPVSNIKETQQRLQSHASRIVNERNCSMNELLKDWHLEVERRIPSSSTQPTRRVLAESCVALQLPLQAVERRDLLNYLDPKFKGEVSFHSFVKFVLGKDYLLEFLDIQSAGISMAATHVLDRIYKNLSSIEMLRNAIHEIAERGASHITIEVLRDALASCGVHILSQELKVLSSQFQSSENSNACIHVENFILSLSRMAEHNCIEEASTHGMGKKLRHKIITILSDCIKHGINYRGELEEIDAQNFGSVTSKLFLYKFQKFHQIGATKVLLTHDDLKYIVRSYPDESIIGNINYSAMLHEAVDKRCTMPDLWQLEEGLRRSIRKKIGGTRSSYTNFESLKPAFNHFDEKGRGSFCIEELFNGLQALGFSASFADADRIFRIMSLGHTTSAYVSLAEFGVFVSDACYVDVENKLAKQLTKSVDLEKFNAYLENLDQDNLLFIGYKPFEQALQNFFVNVSQEDIRRLCFRLDVQQSQMVAYKLLCMRLKSLVNFAPAQEAVKIKNATTLTLENFLTVANSAKMECKSLFKLLKLVDEKRSGLVNMDDFQVCVRKSRVPFTKPMNMFLLQEFGGGENSINYIEMESAIKSATHKVPELPQANLIAYLTKKGASKVLKAMNRFDVDGTGYVDEELFTLAIRKLGYDIKFGGASAIFKKFANPKRKAINYYEFIDCLFPTLNDQKVKVQVKGKKTQNAAERESSSSSDGDVQESHHSIEDQLSSLHNEARRSRSQILRAFMQFDDDSFGVLDRSQFSKALRRIGIKATFEQIQESFISSGVKGCIEYRSYIDEILGEKPGHRPCSPRRRGQSPSWGNSTSRTVASSKNMYLSLEMRNKLKQTFELAEQEGIDITQHFDTISGGKGPRISAKHFSRGMRKLGLHLSNHQLERLADSSTNAFSDDETQYINYVDVMELSSAQDGTKYSPRGNRTFLKYLVRELRRQECSVKKFRAKLLRRCGEDTIIKMDEFVDLCESLNVDLNAEALRKARREFATRSKGCIDVDAILSELEALISQGGTISKKLRQAKYTNLTVRTSYSSSE